MATTASETKVQELYIAYFGRPADPAGLAFYADALDAASTTVEAIATSFAASTEAATIVALDTDAYLSAVYLQAFGRAYVEGTDGTFWKDAINNAATTKELAMVQILEGASGTDTTAVANKVTVAKTYTAAVTADSKDYSSTADAAAAKAVLDAVTEDAATVTSGNTAAQTAVDGLSSTTSNPGSAFALTTDADTVFGTSGDDTITGTQTTYTADDVIVDSSSSDNDTLTIASTAALTATATVVGIENVVINQTSFAQAEATIDDIAASSVTLNQLQAGASTAGLVHGASGTLTFGTGITGAAVVNQTNTVTKDLTVNAGLAATLVHTAATTGDVVLNAGASTTALTGAATTGSVTLNGGALTTNATATAVTTGTATATGDALTTIVLQGAVQNATTIADASTVSLTGNAAADVATVSIGAASTITANDAIETVNISTGTAQTAASIATFDTTAATTYNLTGANSITLAGDEAMFDGKTVTDATTAGTTTLSLTTVAASDLTKVVVDVLEIADTTGGVTLNVAAGQVIKTSAISGADLTLSIDNGDTTYTDGAITLDLGVVAATTKGYIVAANSATADNITTVNVINNTVAQTALELQATATADVVISGSKAVALETNSTAKSISATGLTAALTATAAIATVATITGGTGNDTITVTTAEVNTVDGGAGSDTIVFGADATKAVYTNFEIAQLVGATTDFTASQLSGSTMVVLGDGGNSELQINSALSVNSTTIDLSALVIDSKVTTTVIDGSAVSADIALGNALTFTGTAVADTVSFSTNSGNNVVSTGAGADVITTGAGNDTITAGEGTDAITAGAGVDTIILTETTAVSDTVTTTSGAAYSATNIDSITGFTAGTGGDNVEIDISDAELVTGTTMLTDGNGDQIAAGAGTVVEMAIGTGGTIGGTDEVVVMTTGTFADNAALIQAITSDGSNSASDILWTATTPANGDAFVLAYSDGTDTHIVSIADAAAGTNLTLEVADLTVTNLVTLTGISSIAAGDFVTANFDFVA